MAFATLADFYRHLRAAALVPQARTIVTVDPATDSLLLPMHGLEVAAPCRVVVSGVGGAAPAGLSTTTPYFAIPVGADLIKLATSEANAIAGVAVDITSAGAGVVALVAGIEPLILYHLEATASLIQDALIACGPLGVPYPRSVVAANCHLAALGVASRLGLMNPAQPTQDAENIRMLYASGEAQLAEWRKGAKPAGIVDTTAVAENAPVGWSEGDRGWSHGGAL